MKKLLVLIVCLLVGIAGVGVYRDWFNLAASREENKVNINLSIDTDKVNEDKEKAKETIEELRERVKEKTK